MKEMFRSRHFWILCALMALAAGLRLSRLGDVDVRGDEVELYEFINWGMKPLDYLRHHFEQFSVGRQMPLPRVTSCAYVRSLKLDTTLFNVRLPFAAAGILIVPALWLLGTRSWNRRLGYVLAFMGAINPYNIYWSRTAHIYAYPLLFSTLTAAYMTPLIRSVWTGNAALPRHAVLGGIFSTFAVYSHMSTWPFAGILWAVLIGSVAYLKFKRRPVPSFQWYVLAFAGWLVFLLPWAFLFLKGLLTGHYDSVWKSNVSPLYFFSALWRMPLMMSWGGGWRLVLSAGLMTVGIVAGLCKRETRRMMIATLCLALSVFIAITIMLSTGFFTPRYYSPLWVFFMFSSGVGLVLIAERLANLLLNKTEAAVSTCTIGLNGVLLICMLTPLRCLITLPGNPLPFSRISRWLDQNLPKGTPVVLDGMNMVLHEMKPYAPTNIFLTFTVPDVGLQMWLQYRWRDSVREFALKFPDAVLVEQGKAFYRVPAIGPWTWPRQHFRRRAAITNEQALALRNMVFAPSEDYYQEDTNSVISDIFFNLPEDVVNAAREAGKTTTVLFGRDWKYVKTRDYRDWRVLENRATIDAYNTATSAVEATIVIRGTAVGGEKQVNTPFGTFPVFENTNLVERCLTNVVLAPGRTEIELLDNNWGSKQAPLLVERMGIMQNKKP